MSPFDIFNYSSVLYWFLFFFIFLYILHYIYILPYIYSNLFVWKNIYFYYIIKFKQRNFSFNYFNISDYFIRVVIYSKFYVKRLFFFIYF